MSKTIKKDKSTAASAAPNCPIVGIGASAGGIEVITKIVSQIPNDTGMVFVIIEHLSRESQSHLPEILSRVTKMPVAQAKNLMAVKPNHVYVIPPNFNISIFDDALKLTPRKDTEKSNSSVDFFFESMAQIKKTMAIGVVLTGTGADGATGLKAIKEAGGITIAQDPETAKFDGMPRNAVASGMVDLILPIDGIAKELVRIAKHSYTLNLPVKSLERGDGENEEIIEETENVKNASLNKILGLLRFQTNVNFSKYKRTTLNRRIQRQMLLNKIENIEGYAQYLKSRPDEVVKLFEDIFIHVTDFFRDEESFEALKKEVFPQLIKDRAVTLPIRVWIPGCSTGEEAYSLAIAITEFLGENAPDHQLQIFATDISEAAIQKARKGIYSDFQIRNLSKERLERFFDRVKDGFKIRKRIRDLCVFSRHDLTSNPPIPKLDLLSCRNVLIYFAADLQKLIFPVFHYALNSEGFLWLGKAENPGTISKLFTAIDKINKIYSKNSIPTPLQSQVRGTSYMMESLSGRPPGYPLPPRDSQRNADQMVLLRFAPPGVIIDSDLEIIQFRGRTTPYLEPSPGQASLNLLKMAHTELVSTLRVGVQTVKKRNASYKKENISFTQDKKRKFVDVEIIPINPIDSAKNREFLILFIDTSKKAGAKHNDSKTSEKKSKGSEFISGKSEEVFAQIQNELEVNREYQQSLIEEYESTQEELTSANEELQSTNEELQSTNEELGTAKEELQSSNEELTSMNDELQKRNIDLQNALETNEKSEQRFKHLVEGVKDYAMFILDPSGNISTWNEGAKRLKGYEADEIIGLHFSKFYGPEDLANRKPFHELKVAAETGRVEDEGWRVKKDGSRFWANVIIGALRDKAGRLIGFSKITRDLTEQKKIEIERELAFKKEALLKSAEYARDRFQGMLLKTPIPIAFLKTPDLRFEFANRAFEDLVAKPDLNGLSVYETFPELKGEGLFEIFEKVAKTGETISALEMPAKINAWTDQKYFNFIFQPLLAADKSVETVMIFANEVTEQVLSRKKIEEEEDRLKLALSSAQMAAWDLEIPSHALKMDTAGLRMFGLNPAEFKGTLEHLYSNMHPEDLGFANQDLGKAVDKNETLNRSYRVIWPDGSIHWIQSQGRTFRNKFGEVFRVIGTIFDATEKRNAEENLKNAIVARDEFLSIASHELKTPITSLKLQIQMTHRQVHPELNQAPTPAKLARVLEISGRQVERLEGLIEDLLDVAKIRSGKLDFYAEEVNLAALVEEVVERFETQFKESNTLVQLELEDKVIGGWDKLRIEQVVINLVSNALKYAYGKPIEISIHSREGFAYFKIKDHGQGIPKDKQEIIFERFERATSSRNVSGLGLGLFIVKQIVVGHQGSIELESEVGRGSTFTVRLPLSPTLFQESVNSQLKILGKETN